AGYTPDTAIVWRITSYSPQDGHRNHIGSPLPFGMGEGPGVRAGCSSHPLTPDTSPPDPAQGPIQNPKSKTQNPPSGPHVTDLTQVAPRRPSPLAPRTSQSAPRPFSTFCPKIIASIGRLPDTLADRCIVIRMHRKTQFEQCERLRNLDAADFKRDCIRFVAE